MGSWKNTTSGSPSSGGNRTRGTPPPSTPPRSGASARLICTGAPGNSQSGPNPCSPPCWISPHGPGSSGGADLTHPREHVGELLLETRCTSRGQFVHREPAHVFALGAHAGLGEGRGEGEHDVPVCVAGAEGRGEPVVVEVDRGGVQEPELGESALFTGLPQRARGWSEIAGFHVAPELYPHVPLAVEAQEGVRQIRAEDYGGGREMLGLAPVHSGRSAVQELLELLEGDRARPRRAAQVGEGVGEGMSKGAWGRHDSRV